MRAQLLGSEAGSQVLPACFTARIRPLAEFSDAGLVSGDRAKARHPPDYTSFTCWAAARSGVGKC